MTIGAHMYPTEQESDELIELLLSVAPWSAPRLYLAIQRHIPTERRASLLARYIVFGSEEICRLDNDEIRNYIRLSILRLQAGDYDE